MQSGHSYARESTVEDLEVRRMMSAVTLEDGILIVHGDAGKANAISVTMSKGKVQAAAGRAKLAAAAAKVLAIKIVGGNKADIIDVSPLVKLGAYIDAGAGNDTIRTGGGNDTVVGGAGNDTVVNRGGKDEIFGGAGTNTVQATKKDTVYAGTGKSKVTGGAVNRSATVKNPVIPLPPDAPKPVVTDDERGTEDGTEQPPVVQPVQQEDPPQEPVLQLPDPDEQPPVVTDGGEQQPPPPTDTNPPTDANPPGVQEPGGLDPGSQPQEPTVLQPDDPPPVVVTYGPTLNARDFGAKLDGVTDDSAAIQAALDALPSTGGTLLIDGVAGIGSKGLYLSGKDHITIVGATDGAGFNLLARTVNQRQARWAYGLLDLVSCTNATVRGLTFNGNGIEGIGIFMDRTSDATIQWNTLFGFGGGLGAVGSLGGTRNQYIGNTIRDGAGSCRGFWIGNVFEGELEIDPFISGNTVTRMNATGIGILAHGARVVENNVSDTLGAGLAIAGVTLQTSEDTYVANNTFVRNFFHGIQADCWSPTVTVGSAVIENNVTSENVHSGIYVAKATGWVVRNNECNDNSTGGWGYGSGIAVTWASNITMTGNVCRDTGGARTQMSGIAVTARPGWEVSDVTVTGNVCRGNLLDGVSVTNVGDGTSSDVLVTIDGVTVRNNTCTGNGRYGVCIAEFRSGTIADVWASGNVAEGNEGWAQENFGITALLAA